MVNWTIQQRWGCLGGRGGVSMRGHWWLITEMVEAGSNRLWLENINPRLFAPRSCVHYVFHVSISPPTCIWIKPQCKIHHI